MGGQGIGIGIGAEGVKQPGRALDVGEQEGDRAGREVARPHGRDHAVGLRLRSMGTQRGALELHPVGLTANKGPLIGRELRHAGTVGMERAKSGATWPLVPVGGNPNKGQRRPRSGPALRSRLTRGGPSDRDNSAATVLL